MKKLTALLLVFALCFCFSGCQLLTSGDSENLDFHEDAAYDSEMIDEDNDSFIFTWLNYMEIAVTDTLKEKFAYESHIARLFENMKKINVTDCFVQVRPFADAMYESNFYPVSEYAERADFDVFGVITDTAKDYDIAVHAWINPYRIKNDIGRKELTSDSFLLKYYENGEIILTDRGAYFNPACLSVQRLIIGGAKELMENYDIKGIHIDDYFYPPDVYSADKAQFDFYKKSGGKLGCEDWRRENVNALVKSLYLTVKSFGEDKIFSISPAGNIVKSENELYADVSRWCSEKGYCDIILPQIYFGFENESLPFEKCLSQWKEICKSGKVRLVPALALYKVGKTDEFAGDSGEDEWQENSDILKRQIELIKKGGCGGFALYSASYINFSETFLSEELNNIKSVI